MTRSFQFSILLIIFWYWQCSHFLIKVAKNIKSMHKSYLWWKETYLILPYSSSYHHISTILFVSTAFWKWLLLVFSLFTHHLKVSQGTAFYCGWRCLKLLSFKSWLYKLTKFLFVLTYAQRVPGGSLPCLKAPSSN